MASTYLKRLSRAVAENKKIFDLLRGKDKTPTSELVAAGIAIEKTITGKDNVLKRDSFYIPPWLTQDLRLGYSEMATIIVTKETLLFRSGLLSVARNNDADKRPNAI